MQRNPLMLPPAPFVERKKGGRSKSFIHHLTRVFTGRKEKGNAKRRKEGVSSLFSRCLSSAKIVAHKSRFFFLLRSRSSLSCYFFFKTCTQSRCQTFKSRLSAISISTPPFSAPLYAQYVLLKRIQKKCGGKV